jgi:hypothetical protein
MNHVRKETDLKQLESFCKQSNIIGWCSNTWFNGLVSRYPFDFLYYSQNNKEMQWKRNQTKNKIKDNLAIKLDKVLSLPIAMNDIAFFEHLHNTLDSMIKSREFKIQN